MYKKDKICYGRFRISLDMIDLVKNDMVLNIGTGISGWLENSIKHDAEMIVGSDLELSNLRRVKDDIVVVALDAHFLPFKNECFDKVTIFEVLEHLDEDEKVIEEIYRILKKDSVLILSVPNDNRLNIINPVKYVQHKRHYSINKIRHLINSRNFIIEKEFIGGGIYELIFLYIHLMAKHVFGILYEPAFLEKNIDSEYIISRLSGNDIILRCKRI